MDDVEVANVGDRLTAVGIAGPKSREMLQAAGFKVPDLKRLQFVGTTWQEISATLVRGDNSQVESFELFLARGDNDRVSEALSKVGARPVGTAALDLLRIVSGIPLYGVDIRERDLPQETEQARALNFSKGCYVGQEIVERIRSRGNVHRKFTGFVSQSGEPIAPGSKVVVADADGEKEVGEITSATSLPGEPTRSVALGYIRREHAVPHKEVTIAEAKAWVAALPFA